MEVDSKEFKVHFSLYNGDVVLESYFVLEPIVPALQKLFIQGLKKTPHLSLC